MGFAKTLWKALGLPAASCLLKIAQETEERPAVSRAARPLLAAAACLPEPSYSKTGLRLEYRGQWAHPSKALRGGAPFIENTC